MELKELETLWSEMSKDLETQKKLTNQLIMNMTQERYSNKFQKISTYETIGGVICILAAIFILAKFSMLDIWYLQLCGLFTVIFLILLPVLTLKSLRRIQKLNVADKNLKETLLSFSKAKKKLLFLQRFGLYLSVILMFTILPVASKIMRGKDLFLDTNLWYIYLPIMIVFLFFFGRWGYGCYKSITNSAENILKEME
jgi:amino acid transporter